MHSLRQLCNALSSSSPVEGRKVICECLAWVQMRCLDSKEKAARFAGDDAADASLIVKVKLDAFGPADLDSTGH